MVVVVVGAVVVVVAGVVVVVVVAAVVLVVVGPGRVAKYAAAPPPTTMTTITRIACARVIAETDLSAFFIVTRTLRLSVFKHTSRPIRPEFLNLLSQLALRQTHF